MGAHPQGRAVIAEPLIAMEKAGTAPSGWRPTAARPLAGVKVLDLTRVLAGPVATRFLAGYGADVLRIDPPVWDEPAIEPEVKLGKRFARLELRSLRTARGSSASFRSRLFIHGYRPEASAHSATERTFATRSIRAWSTSASTPMAGRPVAKPARFRQSHPDVDGHCCAGRAARHRQAGLAAGAGARLRPAI